MSTEGRESCKLPGYLTRQRICHSRGILSVALLVRLDIPTVFSIHTHIRTHAHTHTHTGTFTSSTAYIYIYIYICRAQNISTQTLALAECIHCEASIWVGVKTGFAAII